MLRRGLSTNKSLVDSFQKELISSYLRKTSNLFMCVNNVQLAEKVCQAIVPQVLRTTTITTNSKMLFEASPGFGILTERLLQHGVLKIRVFENIDARLKNLKLLQTKYGSRLQIVDKQIIDFVNGNYKLLNLSRDEMSKACFDEIPIQKNWSKKLDKSEEEKIEASFQLVAVLSPFLAREFLTFLVFSLSRYDSFFSTGPTEFYLFVPMTQYWQMISRPSVGQKYYTAFTIHVSSLFDITPIDLYSSDLKKVERVLIDGRQVTTVPSEYFAFTNQRKIKFKDNFIFIHLKPKSLVNRLDAEFMINYVAFVKQSFIKRTNNAIKYYEKHFPGCTIDLIMLGISYFKTLNDLTSDEMFAIFSHLYRTPQYRTSIFNELS